MANKFTSKERGGESHKRKRKKNEIKETKRGGKTNQLV